MLLMVVLMLTGCQTDEPSQKVGLPISICLPASEVKAAQYAPRRAMGDPGTTESYLFPHHLYFIVMRQVDATTWTLWKQEHRTLEDEDWIAKHYVGLLPTMGDSIYQYTEEIDLLLAAGDQFVGHVYAIASAVELSFNTDLKDIASMSQLLNLTFNTADETIQNNLQHIYTSPYNLELDGAYYGSFDSRYQKVPYVNLLLYHVAAKVDITWYVEESARLNKEGKNVALRLTQMDALELFNRPAYCFKPMRNELATKLTDGYDLTDIVTVADEGLWWEGRKYFYTIPYTVTGAPNYFPLQMKMETNASGNYYLPTLKLKIDTTAVFVPWLRANFNIKVPLAAGEAEKIVNNE